MTFGWFVESNSATRKFWHRLEWLALRGKTRLAVPTLVISSGRDDIVIASYVRRFARLIGADVLELPTSKHEPTQETNDIRDATIAAVGAWLDTSGEGRLAAVQETGIVRYHPRKRRAEKLGT
jgi:alpha-beta hydrolase superfamily lysophospholipase